MCIKNVLLAVSAACGLFLAIPANAETVLTFNQWVPSAHHFHARIMKPWADRVFEATEGRVRVEFTAASLGAPHRQFDLARTGVVQIATSNQAYTPERFTLASFAEMPFLSKSAEALSVANWRVTQSHPEILAEYEGMKILTVFSNGGAHIFTRDRTVETLDSVKGLKLRAGGGLPAEIVQLLGAVPVGAPVTEGYQMLSRGIVDGQMSPPDTILSFKLNEFIKHATRFDYGLYTSTFFVVMNEGAWNALPAEDQEAIMRVSGESFARQAGRIWDEQDAKAMQVFRDSSMQILSADEQLEASLHAALQPVIDAWVEKAARRGVDGAALLAETRAILSDIQQ